MARRRHRRLPVVALLVAACAGPGVRPTLAPHPRVLACCRVAPGELEVDGRIEEGAWRAAPWTDPFLDILGPAGPVPRLATRASALWDEEYLYVAARLEEAHVWATLREHDAVIFHDNDFEVFLDPDADHHDYFEIELNALGTEWDLFLPRPYRDGGTADNGWEIPGLRLAVAVAGTLNDPADRDSGWSLELAIPWAALEEGAGTPCPPRAGDRWHLNFSRVEWRHEIENERYRKVPGVPEDNWVWSPQGAVDMHRPEWWGHLVFTDAPPGPLRAAEDPDWPARAWLMAVYHAARAWRSEHGAGPLRLTDLEDSLPQRPRGLEAVRFLPAAGGWRVEARWTPGDGPPSLWALSADSQLQRAVAARDGAIP